MKSLPTFIIAILLFGLCVLEKKSKEVALKSTDIQSNLSVLDPSSRSVTEQDSLKSSTLDLETSYVFNFISVTR